MNEAGDDRNAAIVIGARDPNETRWGMLLVVFMRIIAVLWLAQGLAQWRLILTFDGVLFDQTPVVVSVAIGAFAVFDLLAGVGLWLAAAWGGVIWLLVALGQILCALFVPNFFSLGVLVAALDGVLIALYLFLTWRAGEEPDRRPRARRPSSSWGRPWSWLRR